MLSNNRIKFLRSLKLKKFRQKYKKFIIEGEKIATQVLNTDRYEIDSIYCLDSYASNNTNLLSSFKERLTIVKEGELERISLLKTPNKVLIVANMPEMMDASIQLEGKNIYLDNVQDPGNMGAIIRIADWYGISQIICSPNSAEWFNPKVIQASMGSFLRVRIVYHDFSLLPFSKEHKTYAAAMDGESVTKIQWSANSTLIIGNEGKGIQDQIMNRASHKVAIPKRSSHPDTESLNAAVACGILCHEMMRDLK